MQHAVPGRSTGEESPTAPLRSANILVPEYDEQIEAGAISATDSDSDSAYAGSEYSSASTSLASSVYDYVYENGRRYHKFREGAYALPNDEAEQERLDMLHHIFRLIIGGSLYLSPLSNPQNVLDIGTGTGIWALDFADENPSAEVLGTDLSPIQPEWTAPNCRFLIDDAESDWAYPSNTRFDFIHQRNLVGSIGNWEKLFSQAFENLAPGGWYEAQEFEVWFHAQDTARGSHPESTSIENITKWQQLLDEASSAFGKRLNCAGDLEEPFKKAGFEDVVHDVFRVPIGKWPKDKKLRETGIFLQAQMIDSIEPVSMAYFTRVLGWSKEETTVFIAQVRKEFADHQRRLYVFCHFLRGRKPAGT